MDLLLFGAGGGFVVGAVPVERLVDVAMRWLGRQSRPVRTVAVALGNGAKGLAGLAWLLCTALYVYPLHRTIVGGHGDYGPLLQALRPWVEDATWGLVLSAWQLGHSLLYWLGSSDDPGTGPLTFVVVLLVTLQVTISTTLSLVFAVVVCAGLAPYLRHKAWSWAAALVALDTLASALVLVLSEGNNAENALILLPVVGVEVANLLLGERWRRRNSLAVLKNHKK